MALILQQDEELVPFGAHNTPINVSRQSETVPQRLHALLSHCQSDIEVERELWDDYRIRRRSANTYINQYADILQQIEEEGSHQVDELNRETSSIDLLVRRQTANATKPTRMEWRLKISHDSLTRDLLAMHETLDMLKTRAAKASSATKRGSLPAWMVSGTATLASYLLWTLSYPIAALALLGANISGTAHYHSDEIWFSLRYNAITQCQRDIEALLRHTEEKGHLTGWNREALNGVAFRIVDHFMT